MDTNDMDVSKNRGTPKWMVYNGKPYQNGWFGGTPIFGNTHISMYIPNFPQHSMGMISICSKYIAYIECLGYISYIHIYPRRRLDIQSYLLRRCWEKRYVVGVQSYLRVVGVWMSRDICAVCFVVFDFYQAKSYYRFKHSVYTYIYIHNHNRFRWCFFSAGKC